ncbi:MAG: mannitol dehydrogenase family protein [Pseudomonadota bacterium]
MDELSPSPTARALSDRTLADLSDGVVRPAYDRTSLTPGIVHIGVGNFHRAHQAWYLHRLLQRGDAQDWAIIGAGVRPYDAQIRAHLLAQDCLTTLIELDPGGSSAEVTGAMIDYVPVTEDNRALIDRMSDPAIRIVSLTVTEGGYYTDPATGGFDTDHPDIHHDAAHPNSPRTAFGAMIAALRQRRAAGHGPFTGQSCDNLQGNGQILRQTVVSLARLSDPDLADWIDVRCSFPNSMVDCIVPATGPGEIQLAQRFGIKDPVPVTHENFRQWVIEDDFCAGRPDWDLVGATFCKSVHAHEAMKIRVLNAGHQVLANAGELLSVPTIAECMVHPQIAAFFRKVQEDEILPYVGAVPEWTPQDYLTLIERRFANPEIRDTTRRVAFDGSSRHTGFVLPILRDALDAGGSVEGLSLVEALWARMCAAEREDGSRIEANDPQWETLVEAARKARTAPAKWLDQPAIYGTLADVPTFSATFARWLTLIWDEGTAAALDTYLSGQKTA